MKNKVILIVLIVIGLIVAGRSLTTLRQPGDKNYEEIIIETESEDYENLNSKILELIAEIANVAATHTVKIINVDFCIFNPPI